MAPVASALAAASAHDAASPWHPRLSLWSSSSRYSIKTSTLWLGGDVGMPLGQTLTADGADVGEPLGADDGVVLGSGVTQEAPSQGGAPLQALGVAEGAALEAALGAEEGAADGAADGAEEGDDDVNCVAGVGDLLGGHVAQAFSNTSTRWSP